MKKIKLNKLDLDLYSETLPNGLKVYVVPFKNVNNIYATFTTKFGSKEVDFKCDDRMIHVPYGIAHFLEHKMFEQKDGADPFSFYSERGADANANTDQFKTTYLFSGTDFFEENINYLLNYVQEPYFTDENVEKEKGIIEQEMKMYQDNPYSVMFEKMIMNMFCKHAIREPIIGNYKSIYSITKEDLYNCYNTFYNPKNMFLVVTGNVNPEEVFDIVRKNQNEKELRTVEKIDVKKYSEPARVNKKEEILELNVQVPKIGVGFKLDISKTKISYKKAINYLSLLFDIKYDATSILNEQLKNDGIINDELYLSALAVDNYVGIFIIGESKHPEELISKIKNAIKNKKIDVSDFNRKKKASISSLISISDSIHSINNKIVGNLVRYNKVEEDDYNIIKNLNMKEYNELINNIDFNNITTFIVNPK